MGGGMGGNFGNTKGTKRIKYPGNKPTNKPGKDFEWRGNTPPEGGKGNWYNPNTHERWNPDLNHDYPIGPHWDYTDSSGNTYRVFPDGRIETKQEAK